jgi:hypothetical protein
MEWGISYKITTQWELHSLCAELAINASCHGTQGGAETAWRRHEGVYCLPYEKIMESLRKIPFQSIKIRGELILW